MRPFGENGRIALGGEHRVSGHPGLRSGEVHARLRRHRSSGGGPEHLRNRGQGVSALGEDAGSGTDDLRPAELRVAGADGTHFRDGIADCAQQVVEG